jgi:mono/diheme cytochrome c family protein
MHFWSFLMRIVSRKLVLRLAGVGAFALTLATSLSGCFTSTERSGQTLYEEHCGNCHGLDGKGLGQLIPPLAGADYLHQSRAALPCIVRRGLRGPLTVNGVAYNGIMPALDAKQLPDADVANVLNYIRSAWGNQAVDGVITPQEVTAARCD